MNIKGTAFTEKARLKPSVRTAIVEKINLPALLPSYAKISKSKIYETFKDENGNEFYAVITLKVSEKNPCSVDVKTTPEVEFVD